MGCLGSTICCALGLSIAHEGFCEHFQLRLRDSLRPARVQQQAFHVEARVWGQEGIQWRALREKLLVPLRPLVVLDHLFQIPKFWSEQWQHICKAGRGNQVHVIRQF